MDKEYEASRLYVVSCDTENCSAGHQYGPAVRGYHLIHYIFSGQGRYDVNGQQYHLHAGQGFIIFPGVTTTYQADMEDPWQYGWIGYAGQQADSLTSHVGLNAQFPIFTAGNPEEMRILLSSIRRDVATLRQGEMSATGGLLCFLARIAQSTCAEGSTTSISNDYFRKASWFIEGNLEHRLTVSDVASFVGLCRSQLFRVFRAAAGCGPQEWIAQVRLKRAEQLLTSTVLSLEEVALSCGYADARQMGQAFRRRFGISPRAYRKSSSMDG